MFISCDVLGQITNDNDIWSYKKPPENIIN
jgi:hypothetical protein